MIDVGSLPDVQTHVQAGKLVGVVLVEAIVLYLGYGALEEVTATPLIERIKNT